MKKYTKPSMEIVDLRVEDKITAPVNTAFYRRGINVLNNNVSSEALSDENFATGASF